MDHQQILDLGPDLGRFLGRYQGCFFGPETWTHLLRYVMGQLSDLPRKSVEPIALLCGVPPKTLQQFLTLLKWDDDLLRDITMDIVATEHASPRSVGIFDETSFPKKGDKTPGVQRQWCGALGKVENCLVTVHLAYAADDFRCLLDGDVYLPKSWANDEGRRAEAGVPEEVTFRPKWQVALELYDRAVAREVKFTYVTFDEGYGSKTGFLKGLEQRGQRYVGEVPSTYWCRIMSEERGEFGPVKDHLEGAPELGGPWQPIRVREGTKGVMVWEYKRATIAVRDGDDRPERVLELVVTRNVLTPAEIKYFVSNASAAAPTGELLLAASSRWGVERCFEDAKDQLGMDHYEGRRWLGLQRHLRITTVSLLFLARMREGLARTNAELTCCQVKTATSAWVRHLVSELCSGVDLARRAAAHLLRTARRNAMSRVSHAKTTMKRLLDHGIRSSKLAWCCWSPAWRG